LFDSPNANARMRAFALTPLVVAIPATAFADGYAATFADARAHAEAGEYDEAAARLDALAADYPQDYDVRLTQAWYHFQAADYPQAAAAYRAAYDLSGGGFDAALGLGWTALRMGNLDEAKAWFDETATTRSGDPAVAEAREALATARAARDAAQPGWTWGFYGGGVFEDYVGAAETTGFGLALGVGAAYGRVGVTANVHVGSYQTFTSVGSTTGGNGNGPGFGADSSVSTRESREEVHVGLVWAGKDLGVSAHYAGVFSTNLLSGSGVGLVGRWSPWGDITLEGSATRYSDDVELLRVAPGWRIPVGDHVSITPGVSAQFGDDASFYAGHLNAGLELADVTIYGGALVGEAYRPLRLRTPSFATIDGIEQFAAGGGATLALGNDWSVGASYRFAHFEPSAGRAAETNTDSNDTPAAFDGHTVGLGVQRRMW
jgi:hypothetical protein